MSDYDHSELTLHGRFTDDGSQYRLYVLLNGVEVPVQYLNVAEYREKFDEAAKAGEAQGTTKKKTG